VREIVAGKLDEGAPACGTMSPTLTTDRFSAIKREI